MHAKKKNFFHKEKEKLLTATRDCFLFYSLMKESCSYLIISCVLISCGVKDIKIQAQK